MSWDLLVVDYGGNPPPVEEMGDELPEMGSPDSIRERIDTHLTGIDWSDPDWGVYSGDHFTIEFNLGDLEETNVLMVHVRGEGDAISSLIRFAEPNRWSLFDCSTSEWIEFDNPSQEGWEEFQQLSGRGTDRPERDGPEKAT